MSLAKLFYLKETFREHVRQWRQACFRQRATSSRLTHHASRFSLEVLEPRLLLSATPTELVANQPLEPAAVTVPQGNLPSLDVDLNGQADALTDGIVIIRHLFGFTGTALTNGAVDQAGQRTDPTVISAYLNQFKSTMLDVDQNGSADALTDGILIIRNLFGFTGSSLTSGAIDPAGLRTSPATITTFLDNLNPQRETVAPLMTAGLQQDTGLSTSDAITNNATITGTLADLNAIASFSAGFDATPLANFTNILSDLLPTGTFTLSTLRMNQLAGGTLADGTHTLHLRATDARGNLTTLDRTFTLDTLAPVSPTFDLAVTSDTGIVGDQQTTAAIVTLKGQTDPTTPLQLIGLGTSTLSNGTGTFQLPDLSLAVGANAITLRASDEAGNQSDFTRTITRLAGTQQADVVLTWNQTMLEAIRLDATPPPVASRGMAMVSLAMYDTINAIEGTPGYYVTLPAQPGTDPTAAAASAAYRVLSYLYPGQQALFDSQLAASLASIPNGASKTNGLALGQSIADAIIAIRATDGWNDFVDYVPGTQPGQWQQTAPMYDVALLPQWADLTPFALTSPDQFRPAGPPALTSAAYAAALDEVKALGSATGSTRTADQTEIARFWADGGGTYTPPGHWDQIAAQIALQQGNSLSANARLFAELNVALADAGITAWNTKYADQFWRPLTAIQQADLDGNAATTQDSNWTSLLITPPFPEYISGHSTFSGAAAEILTSLFGANVAFSTTSLGLPIVTRTFTSFEQAAQEAGRSRIYGGIHFEFSNQDGLAAGHQLADFVLNRFTVTTDTQAPKILLNQSTGTVTKTTLTLTGQVLDNLSGVAALQAKLDNGTFAPVTFDATGHFTLTTTLLLDGTADGLHTVTFQATDNKNNVGTVLFSFTLDTKAPIITLTSPADNATLIVTSRLTGTADATGSKLVELCYKFDNGTLVPVSFDPTIGSFDTPLDLSRLSVGAHTLSLRAQDQAGNITTVTKTVTLAAPIPLTIIGVTPQTGASDVGTTFRPQVFFSRPINPTTLNANNFYAIDTTGAKLAATIVPSQDGTFAWLFFTTPMPGASTITIHVDGNTILAAGDGQALDADGDGTAGGVLTSTFSTVSLIPLQGTTLSGKVLDPGPDLKMMTFDDIRVGPDGILHTNDDVFLNPLAGVKVYIIGLENQPVFTDAQGNFSFSAVPSGDIKLAVDGRTATNVPAGMYFPEMVMDLHLEVGRANTVMGTMGTREQKEANLTRPEVYLPRLQASILQTVSNTQDTMIGVDANAAPNLTAEQRQFLTLEVQPGSLIGMDGQVMTDGKVGISAVPPEMVREMLPSALLQHSFDITIQAPGVATFSTPLQITFPNVNGAEPGSKLGLYSFDHTTGNVVFEGSATVSADGLYVITDPGVGIIQPGWHFVQVGTPTQGEPCVRGGVCVQVNNGLLGDVIKVDLSGTGGREFTLLQTSNSLGSVATFQGWDTKLRSEGTFYFVPKFSPTDQSRFSLSPQTAELTFEGLGILKGEEDKGEQRVQFKVQFKEVKAGYSSFALTGSVGAGGTNDPIDVLKVQQRLRWLGFPGKGITPGNASYLGQPMNGIMNQDTIDAVKLFQAAIDPTGSGNPINKDGLVDGGGPASSWLSAINAPRWLQLVPQLRSTVIGTETWATDWALGVIDLAIYNRAQLLRSPAIRVTSLSDPYSDFPTSHVEHKAGLDIDWDVDEVLLANSTPSNTYDSLAQLTSVERDVVEDMQAFYIAASSKGEFDKILFGDTGIVFTDNDPQTVDIDGGFPRIHAALNFLGVLPNSTSPGHVNHIHISLKPPALLAPASEELQVVSELSLTPFAEIPISTASGFGSDERIYYRFHQANGFEIAGQTNILGAFTEILSPNTDYTVTFYQASSNRSAIYHGHTNASGVLSNLGTIILDQFGGPDADGDGIPDVGERALGTSAVLADTDHDGISDSSELTQGLDPLNGRSFPTGIVASVPLLGEAKEVVVEGSTQNGEQQTAFIATGSYGLALVDIANFKNPVVLSQLDLPGDATDVSIDSQLGIAVVAAKAGGLHLIDIANPTSPALIRTIATDASQVEAFDGFAYVAVDGDLRSYNILTGELTQVLSFGIAPLSGLAREGNMLYAMDSSRVLRTFTIGGPVMTPRGSISLAAGGGQLFVGNGVAYAAATSSFWGGFSTVDITNLDNLRVISGPDITPGAPAPAQTIIPNGSGVGLLIGTSAFVNALDVMDLTNLANTNVLLTRIVLPASPFGGAIGAGIGFVAGGSAGLQVVNYRPFDNLGVAPVVSISSPLVDQDPGTPGVQVIEGGTIPISLIATDDVQVRNVELLVNGQVVSNDVSFPFELSAIALGSTPSATTTTVQVRSTDTGGNVALSNTLTFQLVPDTFPPILVSSNVTSGAILGRTLRTIRLEFSEPLDIGTITAQKFQLLGPDGLPHAPSAIQLVNNGSIVQLTYTPLALGSHQLVIKAAAVKDRSGNPLGSQDVVTPFQIFSAVVPTLNPLPPIGSRVYVQSLSGQIDAPFGSESFTISMDAGQLVTMGISPDSASLRPRVELLDSNGTVLGGAESVGIGEGVTLQAVPVPTTGIYTLRVQSLSGTGLFRGVVYLNALQENEFFGGPKNDTLATAMALASSSLPLQGSAERLAVIGVADGGNDYYRFDLIQGQRMFAMLTALGGGGIDLELRDSAGTLLTVGDPGFVSSISKNVVAFQAPITGTYYLNVTGFPNLDPVVGIPDYSLVVTRGSSFEYLSNDTLGTAQSFPVVLQALGSVGTRTLPQVGTTIPDPIDYYSFNATSGDVLQITTTTPGDGAGEPTNTLDPALQLFDPAGSLVAASLNGAADGRNAVISAVAAATGLYKVAVLPTAGAGDYTVRVTGATGQSVSSAFQVIGSSLRSNSSQASVVLTFGSSLLLSSVAPDDVTINGVAATSFEILNSNNVRFNVPGVTPVGGGYTVNLADGVVQSMREGTNTAFSRFITGDTVAPVVTASSINALTVLQPDVPGTFTPLTVTFTFSEAIDQAALTTDDVQLRFGIASQGFDSPINNAASVSYNTTLNQLTAVFNTGLPDSELMTLTLVGGATGIHDLAGNPMNGSPNFPLPSGQGNPASDNYVVEFGVGPLTPSFTPLESDPPIGSLLYFPKNDMVSTFTASGETDVWIVDLKSGQTMGIGLTPTNGIQGKLTIVDPNGVTLGTVSSTIAGKTIAIVDIPIAIAGIYRVEVTSLSGIGAYDVGFGLNSAFDVEDPVLATGTNNTVATAQSLAVSAISLQGTASRLAAEGAISSSFDADLYSFQGAAGQPVTLVSRGFSFAATPIVQLLKSDGTLLATGSVVVDGTVRLSDYVLPQAGTYLVRIASPDESFDYDLIVTRGASFEQAGTPSVPQDITLSGQVLGGLEKQGHGANGAIRVAVLGGADAVPLVSQLNDDTYYDFEAVSVTGTDIDTFQELSNYDVVVIGDPTSRAQLQGTVEQALQNWLFSGGGGLVGTGGLITAAGPVGGTTLFSLDNVIPINLNAASTTTTNPILTIAPTPHEVTEGLSTFTVDGSVELPAGTVDQDAVLLGTVNGTPAVVARDFFSGGDGPRSAYVGPTYFNSTATGLRSGIADRLLEQTIAWASHVDITDSYRVNANVGDQLVVNTTTPLDGPHLPQNLLDPRIELLNPAGMLVASNDNGAADGKNALINYTVPVGAGGQYTIRVRGLQSGEYTVAVTGATGAASASSVSSLLAAPLSVSTTTSDLGLSSSLAYVQSSWVTDFVANPLVVDSSKEEELLIALSI